MYDLKDKIVLITGAANGIGAAIVEDLLENGAKHVRILDIDEKTGQEFEDQLNKKYGKDKAKFVKCDVTNDEQFFSALEAVKEDNGYLDLLINNAGVTRENSFALIRKQIEINLIALMNGTLKAIELMRTDKGGRGGTVINNASIAGLLPVCAPLFTYSTTKCAVIRFSTCVGRQHCANTGVRVMSVCFGVTDTPIIGTMNCFDQSLDQEVQRIVKENPIQTVQAASRGAIEVYQKGENATTWMVVNNEPARDVTSALNKADEAMGRILVGAE